MRCGSVILDPANVCEFDSAAPDVPAESPIAGRCHVALQHPQWSHKVWSAALATAQIRLPKKLRFLPKTRIPLQTEDPFIHRHRRLASSRFGLQAGTNDPAMFPSPTGHDENASRQEPTKPASLPLKRDATFQQIAATPVRIKPLVMVIDFPLSDITSGFPS
jgi:hypothetical protein